MAPLDQKRKHDKASIKDTNFNKGRKAFSGVNKKKKKKWIPHNKVFEGSVKEGKFVLINVFFPSLILI